MIPHQHHASLFLQCDLSARHHRFVIHHRTVSEHPFHPVKILFRQRYILLKHSDPMFRLGDIKRRLELTFLTGKGRRLLLVVEVFLKGGPLMLVAMFGMARPGCVRQGKETG